VRHQVPEELSLIVGDLLHNARSALDHLVTSAAWDFALKSDRQLSPADERRLFFPVTRTEPDFDGAVNKIEPYLSEETMARIRTAQPWSVTAARLAHEHEAVTADEFDLLTWLNPLWRLHLLDNLDKHREVLALDLHRATITLGDDAFEPLDDGGEPAGEPITSFDELDPRPGKICSKHFVSYKSTTHGRIRMISISPPVNSVTALRSAGIYGMIAGRWLVAYPQEETCGWCCGSRN
jgi:hypothetical protein